MGNETINGTNNSNIELKLGDIIEINSPTNPQYHQNVYYIDYIDANKIVIINVSTAGKSMLSLDAKGALNDESITYIALLDRSEQEGYARQNKLTPHTWIDIHIEGEFPTIITGEITNVEEDMIEVKTVDKDIIYIDFEYKGIPQNIPFKSFVIREKPKFAQSTYGDESDEESEEKATHCEKPLDETATMEYSENGEMVINIPENAEADLDIKQTLEKIYKDSNEIVFGEELDDAVERVEIDEKKKLYSIGIQVNDLMDELLSTIPNEKRTKSVLEHIHMLIERFKQLRSNFTKFDENNNVVEYIYKGPLYKPLVDKIHGINMKLNWIIPVVKQKRRLFVDEVDPNSQGDVIVTDLNSDLEQHLAKENIYKNDRSVVDRYNKFYNELDKMPPFEPIEENALAVGTVMSELDAVVDNLGDFESTVQSATRITSRFVIQRYNLGLMKKAARVTNSGNTVFFRANMTPDDSMALKSMLIMPEPLVRASKVQLPSSNILQKAELNKNYISLFRLLNNKTELSNYIIDNIDNAIDFENEENHDFISQITNYSLSEDLEEEPDKFRKLLNVMIPNTRTLFRQIRKYVKNKMSLLGVVAELEPFMVYNEGISYQDFMEIRYFIKERISEFKKSIAKRGETFRYIRDQEYKTSTRMNPIERLLFDKGEMIEKFRDGYGLKEVELNKLSTSELLSYLLTKDNSNLLSTIVTFMTIKELSTPDDLLRDL